MKNRILSLLLFLLAAVNMHAAEGITIRFDVKNPVLSNVVLVYHMSVNEFPLTDGKATVQQERISSEGRRCNHLVRCQRFRQYFRRNGRQREGYRLLE